ncbi:MAG: hypothetical protein ABJI69_01060 [Balneola sp.]
MGNTIDTIMGEKYLGSLVSDINNFAEQKSQLLNQSCSVNAQAEYLREATGYTPDEARLIHDAEVNGLYNSPFDVKGFGGTPGIGNPKIIRTLDGELLKRAGIPSEKLQEFSQIDSHLANGKRIMLGVDSEEFVKGATDEIGSEVTNHIVMVKEKLDSSYYKVYDPQSGSDFKVHKSVLEQASTEPGNPINAKAFPDPKEYNDQAKEYLNKINQYPEEEVKETISRFKFEENYELYGSDVNNKEGVFSDMVGKPVHSGGEEVIEESLNDAFTDVSDIVDTVGTVGIFALVTYFDENPDKKSKVLKAGLTLGVLDSVLEVSGDGIDIALEASPLLIAAIFLGALEFMKRRSKTTISPMTLKVLSVFQKTMVLTQYTAIGIFVLDTLLEINDAFDLGIELVDEIDGLLEAAGLVAEGVDIVDSISTFGLSILISQRIKKYGEDQNDKVLKKIGAHREIVQKRRALGGLLASGLPPAALVGIKKEWDKS